MKKERKSRAPARLVLVEWLDSRRPDPTWQHLTDLDQQGICKCASVGWLIRDDETLKILAPNMGDIDDVRNVQVSGCISIPTQSVTAIKLLKEII